MYSFDDEYAALAFDFSDSVGCQEFFAGWYSARLKGAAKSAGHSACGGGDYVVECSGVRLGDVGRDAVVFGDFGVDSEHHGSIDGHVCGSEWAFDAFDLDVGSVSDVVLRCRCHVGFLGGVQVVFDSAGDGGLDLGCLGFF